MFNLMNDIILYHDNHKQILILIYNDKSTESKSCAYISKLYVLEFPYYPIDPSIAKQQIGLQLIYFLHNCLF